MAEFICPVVVETCVLTPEFASYQCGEDHTVTATLTDDTRSRGAVAGRMIDFEIIAGPQAGTVYSEETGVDGIAYFTYTGVLEGTDTITASFINNEGLPQMAENEVMAEFICPIVGEAWIRYVDLDLPCYEAGEEVEITIEVDTNLEFHDVEVETNLLDPDGVNITGTSRYIQIELENDDPFTEILTIPNGSPDGMYTVQVIVNDSITYIQQDLWLVPFEVGCAITPVILSSFTAVFDGSSPTLQWTTQSENNNLGWNVYRSLSENVEQSNQMNNVLIPGYGTTSEPTDYVFTDVNEVENNTSYWYWIESTSYSGETEIFGPVTLSIQIEDNQTPDLPTESVLQGNYPNPFNPHTMIRFSIQDGENGALTIYNTKGQLLETHHYEAGDHELNWNAAQYGSGIYFYKLETLNYTNIKKMIMVK